MIVGVLAAYLGGFRWRGINISPTSEICEDPCGGRCDRRHIFLKSLLFTSELFAQKQDKRPAVAPELLTGATLRQGGLFEHRQFASSIGHCAVAKATQGGRLARINAPVEEPS
jgi:hypothetical protein